MRLCLRCENFARPSPNPLSCVLALICVAIACADLCWLSYCSVNAYYGATSNVQSIAGIVTLCFTLVFTVFLLPLLCIKFWNRIAGVDGEKLCGWGGASMRAALKLYRAGGIRAVRLAWSCQEPRSPYGPRRPFWILGRVIFLVLALWLSVSFVIWQVGRLFVVGELMPVHRMFRNLAISPYEWQKYGLAGDTIRGDILMVFVVMNVLGGVLYTIALIKARYICGYSECESTELVGCESPRAVRILEEQLKRELAYEPPTTPIDMTIDRSDWLYGLPSNLQAEILGWGAHLPSGGASTSDPGPTTSNDSAADAKSPEPVGEPNKPK